MEWVVVDNNHLSVEQNQSRSEELVNCQGDTSCRSAVRDKYRQEYDKVQERIATCSGADQCVAVAKELRALQSNYSARIGEIQEKARMQGLDSLTPAEVREWANLRGAMSNIDASRKFGTPSCPSHRRLRRNHPGNHEDYGADGNCGVCGSGWRDQ
ncbi:hypothetical protein [Photorhabdus sp. RW14-46]|uniref:hypothetical protein n=1 Tax=Photorhabdus sp. RW14-46 TaxID=2100168 RepID=UPI001F607901|nr:hypothetical protein [Photorhabdus sp. RW14-46]